MGKVKRGRLVEFQPGKFARVGEVVTGSDGVRWKMYNLDDPLGSERKPGPFRAAWLPTAGPAGNYSGPPPELHFRKSNLPSNEQSNKRKK